MYTQLISPSPQSISELARYFQKGDIIAFPTETVYGLGADATNSIAVKKIFSAKTRPSDNPLIVHVSQKVHISKYARIRHPLEHILIQKCMPGPLTLVLESDAQICTEVRAGGSTIGIRVPAHPIAQAFLDACGVPVAAPSANRSGRPSPTSAEMVLSDLDGLIPYILDGGVCAYGIESTVVKIIDNAVRILRPGFVTQEDLQGIVGPDIEVTFASTHLEQSPGTRYTHYAPDAPVYITQDLGVSVAEYSRKHPAHTIGVICTSEARANSDISAGDRTYYFNWGSHTNLAVCAARLYQIYHTASQKKVDAIFIEHLPEEGIGLSIMNRVKKSAV